MMATPWYYQRGKNGKFVVRRMEKLYVLCLVDFEL